MKKPTDFDSIGDLIRDPNVIWYGPHECREYGALVVKSSEESGGVALDAPHGHHYPNHPWRLHQCRANGSDCVKVAVDLSVGKIIRIKSTATHAHSVWRITGHMDGASQHENLVAIRRLELNPGNNLDGKVQEDSIIPMAILSTHPGIENV